MFWLFIRNYVHIIYLNIYSSRQSAALSYVTQYASIRLKKLIEFEIIPSEDRIHIIAFTVRRCTHRGDGFFSDFVFIFKCNKVRFTYVLFYLFIYYFVAKDVNTSCFITFKYDHSKHKVMKV